ncbi:MAG: 4Fe-4S binding protein [Chloroflexi bacterium]|nr:4Fe-4S binding protein [Chloroflexota bacterium]
MTGVLIVACDDLASACGVDPNALEAALRMRSGAVRLRTVAGVCGDARALAAAVEGEAAAVLALCAPRLTRGALQTAVRRAGLDPLGVPVVSLRARCAPHPPDVAVARAETILAGAVARARAFRGSRPEQVRARPTRLRSRRSLLLADVEYEPVAAVARARCAAMAGCALCVPICPAGALVRDDGHVSLDRSRCDGCGACVAACPREAIEIPAYRDEELWAEIGALLAGADGALGSRGIAFFCRHVELSGEAPGWLPVVLPSLRLLTPVWIVRCLDAGANAVAVLECEICVNESLRAGVAWCGALLGAIGADPYRARLVGPSGLAAPPPPAGSVHRSEPTFLGEAAAVLSLVDAERPSDGAELTHPGSPFGRVSVGVERCTLCGACAKACPTGALALLETPSERALTFDHACCVACGSCERTCPEGRGVVGVVRSTSPKLLRAGPVALVRDEQARCVRCGAPIAPGTMLGRVAALLGKEHAALMPTLMRCCSTCRVLAGEDHPTTRTMSPTGEVPLVR